MSKYQYVQRDEELRIAAAKICIKRLAHSPGVATQIIGSPKPVDEFLKDAHEVYLWLSGKNPGKPRP